MGGQRRVAFSIVQDKWLARSYTHGCVGTFAFINDFSRRIWIYFLKHKSEVFQKFKKWKAKVGNPKG